MIPPQLAVAGAALGVSVGWAVVFRVAKRNRQLAATLSFGLAFLSPSLALLQIPGETILCAAVLFFAAGALHAYRYYRPVMSRAVPVHVGHDDETGGEERPEEERPIEAHA